MGGSPGFDKQRVISERIVSDVSNYRYFRIVMKINKYIVYERMDQII